MSDDNKGIERYDQTVMTAPQPGIMQIVAQLAENPTLEKVEVIERLLAMKEREEVREAKRLFTDALTELKSEMGPIHKNAEIRVKGTLRSKYAAIEDIDDVIGPLMVKYGFTFTLSQCGIHDGMREFAGTLSHRAGHEKAISVFMPLDKSDFRSPVQNEGSTISYARRQLYKAHFNIVERGQDDDGSGEGVAVISEDEAMDLTAKLEEVKANVAGFLEYFSIAKLADLKKADLSRAYEMIQRKGRK